jgi:hypothetical protein
MMDVCIDHFAQCSTLQWNILYYILYLRFPSAYLMQPFYYEYKLLNCHEYSWNTGTLSYNVKYQSINQSINTLG